MIFEADQDKGMEKYPCPKCGQETSLGKGECEHCGADLSVLQTTISAANVHFNRALDFVKEDRLDEAVLEIQAALELWDRNPKFHVLLGKVLARKGMYSRAIIQWEKAIELNPNSASAYRNIEQARKLERFAGQREAQKIPRWAIIGLSILSFIMLVWVVVLADKYEDEEDSFHKAKKKIAALEDLVVHYEAQETALAMWFQTPTPTRPPTRTPKPKPTETPTEPGPTPTLRIVVELEEEISYLKTQVNQRETLLEQYQNQLNEAKEKAATAEYDLSLLSEKLNGLRTTLEAEAQEAKARAAESRESEKRAQEFAREKEEQSQLLRERIRVLEKQRTVLDNEKKAALAKLEEIRSRIRNLMTTDRELETYFEDIMSITPEALPEPPEIGTGTSEADPVSAPSDVEQATEVQDASIEYPAHGYREIGEVTAEAPLPEPIPSDATPETSEVRSTTPEAAPVPESAT